VSTASRLIPALLLLANCAAAPASLPDVPLAMPQGAGDPVRGAVLAAAPAFADPAGLARRPAEAARQAARLEWLAASLVEQPDWRRASPLLGPALRAGRAELRAALGVPDHAPARLVAAALLDAAGALESGQVARAEAALDQVSEGQGREVLRRLAHLPPLPRAAEATSLAQAELMGDGRWDLD